MARGACWGAAWASIARRRRRDAPRGPSPVAIDRSSDGAIDARDARRGRAAPRVSAAAAKAPRARRSKRRTRRGRREGRATRVDRRRKRRDRARRTRVVAAAPRRLEARDELRLEPGRVQALGLELLAELRDRHLRRGRGGGHGESGRGGARAATIGRARRSARPPRRPRRDDVAIKCLNCGWVKNFLENAHKAFKSLSKRAHGGPLRPRRGTPCLSYAHPLPFRIDPTPRTFPRSTPRCARAAGAVVRVRARPSRVASRSVSRLPYVFFSNVRLRPPSAAARTRSSR